MKLDPRSKSSSTRTYAYALGLAVVLGSLLGILGVAEPAAADLLILRGGGEIETDGPWRVDGRRVLFETPAGRYSSLRVSEVDLEASRERTRRTEAAERIPARETARPVRTEKPEPRWVITDDDVSTVPTARERPPVPRVVGDEDFDVLSLREEVDASGFHLVVRGTLVNGGSDYKSDLVVQVRLVDPRSGGHIATSPASLDTQDLPPGGATRFTARFPNTGPDSGMVQVQAVQAEDEAFFGS